MHQRAPRLVFLWVDVEEGKGAHPRPTSRPSRPPCGGSSRCSPVRSGAAPAEVARIPDDLLDQLGLSETLGMNRTQGLTAILYRIRLRGRRRLMLGVSTSRGADGFLRRRERATCPPTGTFTSASGSSASTSCAWATRWTARPARAARAERHAGEGHHRQRPAARRIRRRLEFDRLGDIHPTSSSGSSSDWCARASPTSPTASSTSSAPSARGSAPSSSPRPRRKTMVLQSIAQGSRRTTRRRACSCCWWTSGPRKS